MIEDDEEHECEFWCPRCGETTNDPVFMPLKNMEMFLNTLTYCGENERIGGITDYTAAKMREFKIKTKFHKCVYKHSVQTLCDYLIVHDIETFRDYTGVLVPYLVSWTVACFYEEGWLDCDHGYEIHSVTGKYCFKEFLQFIFSLNIFKNKKYR